jgi:hypothetical protein
MIWIWIKEISKCKNLQQKSRRKARVSVIPYLF